MPVEVTRGHDASEAEALAEIGGHGFAAEAKDYAPGRTDPHCHDYDVLLHILSGEFRLGLVEEGVTHSAGPGNRVFVPAGTLHTEDHGPLRMVVGRRKPGVSQQSAQP